MQSPLHGYVDASDMVDPNPPTAHMWNKVFASMADVGKALVEKRSDPEWKAKHQEKRAGRIEERVAKRTQKGKKGYEVDITTDTSWGGLIPKINVEHVGDKATKRLDKAQELRERAEENKILAEKNKTKKNQDKLLAAYKAGNLTLDQYNQLAGNTSNPNTKNTSTSGLTFNEDGFTDEVTLTDGTKKKIEKCSSPHFDNDPKGFKALGCKEV